MKGGSFVRMVKSFGVECMFLHFTLDDHEFIGFRKCAELWLK